MGISRNAVMIQIWTTLITILILLALKVMAQYSWYLSNHVAFIRLNLFVKVALANRLNSPFQEHPPPDISTVQRFFFEFQCKQRWTRTVTLCISTKQNVSDRIGMRTKKKWLKLMRYWYKWLGVNGNLVTSKSCTFKL